MLPVLGREVIEGKQRVAILGQALGRLVVFAAPGFDEGLERYEGVLPGLGHPDLLERPLGLRLQTLRQLVEDIGGLVHPAALASDRRPHLLDRLPEAECAVGDRELGSHRKTTPLQIEEQFLPRLRALAHAVDEADEFLLALGCGANDDQQALRVVLEPSLHMNTVDPEVNVAFGREIAPAPARVLVRPGVLEAGNGRGREPAGVFAEQRQERLLEIAGGDALQVEDREQHTATGPMPVMISRSGRCPWRTMRRRPSSVSLSAWPLRKAATSASTACASNARAPLRKTSVSGSAKVPGWESCKTLVSVTAYHSFSGEVEASNTPTIRRLPLHAVTNFRP